MYEFLNLLSILVFILIVLGIPLFLTFYYSEPLIIQVWALIFSGLSLCATIWKE